MKLVCSSYALQNVDINMKIPRGGCVGIPEFSIAIQIFPKSMESNSFSTGTKKSIFGPKRL